MISIRNMCKANKLAVVVIVVVVVVVIVVNY